MAELKPHGTIRGSMTNGWEDSTPIEKLEYELSKKQDKLTAGNGIVIDQENTISSTTTDSFSNVDWDELLAHYNYYKK